MANETVVRVTADASGYTAEMERAKRSAQAFLTSQEEAAKRTQAAQAAVAEAVSNGSDASARKINAFMQSLTKQAESAGKARSELLQMQAAQLGVAGAAQAYIDKIKKAEEGVHSFSMETAGARRELLVLAHEASQGNWKDFGGSLLVLGERTDALGAIFSATGLSVGLMVAGFAGLVVAAIKGTESAKQFNAALILTNNYAGLTAQSLQDMTQRIAGSPGESLGKANDVLMALAQSGRYTSTEMEGLGNVIVRTAKISGASLEDVMKDYEKLADDPTAWAEEHNKSMHFMDVATYQHIQALQDAGDKHKAVQAVIEAVTAQVESSSTQHLSGASKAWQDLTAGVQEFWVNLKKGLSTGATYQDQIAILLGERKDIQGNSFAAKRVAEIDQQVAALQELERMQKRLAESQARTGEINRAGVDAAANVEKMRDQFLTNAQRRQKELEKLAKDRKSILAGGGEFSDKDYADLVAGINTKYKDTAQKPVVDDAATRFIQQLRDQDAAIRAELESTTKLTGAEKQQAEFAQKIADIKGKSILTAEQKSLLANQGKIEAQLGQNVADEKALKLKQDILKLEERSAQLNAQIASYQQTQRDQYERQLDAYGKGSEAQKNAEAVKSIYREYQRMQAELDKATPKELLGGADYAAAQENIRAGLQASLKDYDAYYSALKEKQADWTVGASQALANYRESAANVAQQTESVFSSAFRGMEDAFVKFVQTGKLSFTDLANSIIADLVRIQARKAIAGIIDSASGWLGSLIGGSSSGSSSSSNYSAGMFDGVKLDGARAEGGPVWAGASFLVGERGPEVFTPSGAGTIIPNHALQGVGSLSGGMPSVQIVQHINVDSRSDQASITQAMVQAKNAAINEIQQSIRNGSRAYQRG